MFLENLFYNIKIAFNNALNDELVVSRFEYIKSFKEFETRIKDEKYAKETAQLKYDRQTELVHDVKAKNAVLEIDNQILLSGVKPDGYFKPVYQPIQLSDKIYKSISGKKYFERPAYTRKEVIDEIIKNGLDPKGVILVEVEVIHAQH